MADSVASTSAHRLAHSSAILPDNDLVQDAKVLVVGAGGIGCEVLKNLALVGVRGVEVIDLDTIDLSNLNRQFLFNKSHINKSKALVAASVASSFNPAISIKPYHANIKDPQFGFHFFQRFDVVLNALDNLDARRWVNRMCIATGVPLVESGTTGFVGQVQPIVKGILACYDCTEKPVQKTFPVCTIRSTPSTPIHCVVWAKTWLFNQLFGQDDETEAAELDKAEADGGNSDEINALRKEAREMSDLRASLTQPGAAQRVFDKVFKGDIERLLSMDEMWRNRRRPTSIAYQDAIKAEPQQQQQQNSGLKDQVQLGLRETAELFEKSLGALSTRAAADPSEPLSFDKDDSDALDFVTAASNLRSRIYYIDTKTRFDVKQMAGNIIPAIASTNAIIAGSLTLQMIHMLRGRAGQAQSYKAANDVLKGKSSAYILAGSQAAKPNPACAVCQDVYIPLQLDPSTVTLGELIRFAQSPRQDGDGDGDGDDNEAGGLGLDEDLELGTYEGTRLLADPGFDDNHSKALADLGVKDGTFLQLVDEDGVKATVQLIVVASQGAPPAPAKIGVLPLPVPAVGGTEAPRARALPDLVDRLVLPKPATTDAPSGADDDDDDDGAVVALSAEEAAAATAAAAAGPRGTKRKSSPGGSGDAAQSQPQKRKNPSDSAEAARADGAVEVVDLDGDSADEEEAHSGNGNAKRLKSSAGAANANGSGSGSGSGHGHGRPGEGTSSDGAEAGAAGEGAEDVIVLD